MIAITETDIPIHREIIIASKLPEYLIAISPEVSAKIYEEADPYKVPQIFVLVYRFERDLGQYYSFYLFSGIRLK